MKRWLVIVVALVACRGSSDEHARPDDEVHRSSPTRTASVDATAGSNSADPWNATPKSEPDDPPSLAERHALADKACPKVTAPFFYTVEKNHVVNHLLGTRHIGVGLAKFPPAVRDALHDAKLGVFELAPTDRTHADHPDLSLPDELGPTLWAHYRQLVGARLAQTTEHGRPSGALLLMMVMYEDMSATLESELEHELAAGKIPMHGLETAAFQDELLDRMLDLRMLKATVSYIKDRDKLQHDSAKDLGEYCAGTDETPGLDDESRAEMLAGGFTPAELDAIDEEMVFARNKRWIPKLEAMFAEGNVFVAVGADHLIGVRGVVSLLRARGFTVTRFAP
jgi:hypothetical protein